MFWCPTCLEACGILVPWPEIKHLHPYIGSWSVNHRGSHYFWRRQWHPTPVLLPGKSHGRRSLVGCSPWGRWESDTTEQLPFHFSLSRIGEGNGNSLQCSCLDNPRDGGGWWAAVYGVAQSRIRLKRLSSSSRFSVIDSSLLVDFPRPWSRWPLAVWVLLYGRCGPCRQELRVMCVWASLGVLGESPNPRTAVIHGISRILGGEKEFVFVV